MPWLHHNSIQDARQEGCKTYGKVRTNGGGGAGHHHPQHKARPPRRAPPPRSARPARAPMSTGEALATLPTSSSDCIIFLMRACREALALIPLSAAAMGLVPPLAPPTQNLARLRGVVSARRSIARHPPADYRPSFAGATQVCRQEAHLWMMRGGQRTRWGLGRAGWLVLHVLQGAHSEAGWFEHSGAGPPGGPPGRRPPATAPMAGWLAVAAFYTLFGRRIQHTARCRALCLHSAY